MSRPVQRRPIGDANDPRGFEVLIARYLESLAVRGYSESTQRNGRSYLRSFARWCEEREVTRPGEVPRPLVERYQRWLFHHRRENGKPLGVVTQHGMLQRLKAFFAWLTKQRYLLYNPASELELPRLPPTLPVDSFTLEEVEQVLSTPELGTAVGLRDRALLETLYSTGIRRKEVVALELYDIDFERGVLVVRQGKGGHSRVVPIGDRAVSWVSKYLEEARPELVVNPDEQTLFLSGEGQRFSADGLGNRVKKVLKASGVRRRFGGVCHLFRHTMATQMLEGGADIRFIQEMLGHANLETTQIYTKVSIRKLKEIHAATHPAKLERTSELAQELAEEIDDVEEEELLPGEPDDS